MRARALCTESDDTPIVTGAAAAPSFPTVAHIASETGHYKILSMAKELIARRNYITSVFRCSEIDLAVPVFQRPSWAARARVLEGARRRRQDIS